MRNAEESMRLYLTKLYTDYTTLNSILLMEAEDIKAADEKKLLDHSELERDTVEQLRSLTKTVHTYIEKSEISPESEELLRGISFEKKKAQKQIDINIEALEKSMIEIKRKINSIKLPQSARRVYYSGSNPSLMDIEI